MTIPRTLEDQVADLYRRDAERSRRERNRKRTGVVAEVDHAKGVAKVKLSSPGGKDFVTGWLPWKEIASGGIKSHIPPTVGEQVNVVSESGDLTDAEIDMSIPSTANPRPHDGAEAVITKGGSRITIGDDTVVIAASRIVLDGEVHLGGEGGALVHRKGDVDSDGDSAVGSASRVYAL